MWRKFLFLSICILALITIFSLFYIKNSRAREKSYLPELSFSDSNGNSINSTTMQNYKGYCIVLFNSDCEICQAEAEIISLAKNIYKENCFILLSPEPNSTINLFVLKHKLKSDNVYVGSELSDTIFQKFDGESAPFVFIYKDNRELVYKESTAQLNTFKKYWKSDHK